MSRTSSGASGNGRSAAPAASHDGRIIVFESWASNLVDGDTNDRPDVFVFDRQTSQMTRVSVTSSGAQATFDARWDWLVGPPSISANGRFVTFASGANNLAPADTAKDCVIDLIGAVNCPDVFVHDRLTGSTERVSINTAGQPADGGAPSGVTSDDGRYVVFVSSATNLGAGTPLFAFSSPNAGGLFIRDRAPGTTTPL